MRNLILQTFLLVLLIYPLSLSAQNSFSLSLDVDGATGDQAVTSLNTSADQAIAIQIFGNNIQNANGLAVRFEYDASQVTYEGFDAGDVLPNAQALPSQGTGFVEIGIASLGGQATANSGLVGTVRFRTTGAFSGTEIRLVRAELGRSGRFETVTIDVRVELKLQVLTPDFNRDGMVNFADFLAFAGQFGARQGDGRYEAKYDLDSDGEIGFGDFLIFGSSYGKETSTQPRPVNGSGTTVTIPDANLRAVIADKLGKASGAPISKAEMATLTRLEAPNSNISDLTGLEFATGLTYLYLGSELINGRYVNSNEISNLSPLSGLTNLTVLNLWNNLISDVSALSNLTNLTELWLGGNLISDVSALPNLTNLTELWLGDNLISDVSALSNLTNLTELVLDNNSISDVTPLSSLTNLTRLLSLNNNLISDVAPLSNLTNLTELWLRNNLISDVSALSNLTNLTELWLGDNLISDISPLSNLINLTELWLYNNLISDVSPLPNLTNLTVLSLSRNSISDVSALSNLTNLTYLALSTNSISDVSPLSNLTNLTVLLFDENSFSDISLLSNLTNLTELWLYNNSISDISPLSNLTNLTILELFTNSISNLSPLVANTGLGSGDRVNVRDNPLSVTSLNTHIPALQNRGVEVYFGSSKPGVEEIERGMIHEDWEARNHIYRGRMEEESRNDSREPLMR